MTARERRLLAAVNETISARPTREKPSSIAALAAVAASGEKD
jgi:hypothetical protein